MNRSSLGLALGFLLSSCATGPTGPHDARNSSFGGRDTKADGAFSECELVEVLKFVNSSDATVARLKGMLSASSTGADAAAAIVRHRNGPDGDAGTGDDDIFDDLGELDAVQFVGPIALDSLVTELRPACTVDLSTRPFIDSMTFGTASGGGWARDGVELESVHGVTGITGQQLQALLTSRSGSGRTLFSRIRRSRIMEAFTYEYGVDEMPWDSESHAAREGLPFVALSIESDRYIPDEGTMGPRELSIGTDLMDDAYYDTRGFQLLRNGYVLRARSRWDDPTTVRRLLIGLKSDTIVDENGIKRAGKIDVRNDSASPEDIMALNNDVLRGLTSWSTADAPVEPIRAVYEDLRMQELLPAIEGHEAVLLLDPIAHLRSVRSRYHQNEASIRAVQAFHANGETRIREVLAAITAAGGAGAAGREFETLANAVLDQSAIADRAGLAAGDVTLPATWTTVPTSYEQLEQRREIAEAIDALYHDLGEQLDGLLDAVSGVDEDALEDYVDHFMAWQRSVNPALATKTVMDPFIAAYPTADRDTFNAYGEDQRAAMNEDFEDFRAIDDSDWTTLESALRRKHFDLLHRQIEGAGTAARALWFDNAREFYVPDSGRATVSFMIDTMDHTIMLTHEEWESIPEAERTFETEIPPEKIFNTMLVNELQIELGSETAYIARIEALQMATDADAMRNLEGAQFVFQQYTGAMSYLAEIKGEAILEALRDAGAPAGIGWEETERSKGQTALMTIADDL